MGQCHIFRGGVLPALERCPPYLGVWGVAKGSLGVRVGLWKSLSCRGAGSTRTGRREGSGSMGRKHSFLEPQGDESREEWMRPGREEGSRMEKQERKKPLEERVGKGQKTEEK